MVEQIIRIGPATTGATAGRYIHHTTLDYRIAWWFPRPERLLLQAGRLAGAVAGVEAGAEAGEVVG